MAEESLPQQNSTRNAGPCPGCGATDFHASYTATCPEKIRMDATGECWTCAFWEVRCAGGSPLVIDGHVYGVGAEPKGQRYDRGMLGMGGRRFDIEIFDGRRFTTHNLWSGGQIPERFRERLPDTARFIGGGKTQVGETTCWNPARESDPAYPTYFEIARAPVQEVDR